MRTPEETARLVNAGGVDVETSGGRVKVHLLRDVDGQWCPTWGGPSLKGPGICDWRDVVGSLAAALAEARAEVAALREGLSLTYKQAVEAAGLAVAVTTPESYVDLLRGLAALRKVVEMVREWQAAQLRARAASRANSEHWRDRMHNCAGPEALSAAEAADAALAAVTAIESRMLASTLPEVSRG